MALPYIYTLDEVNICSYSLVDHDKHDLPESWWLDQETNRYRSNDCSVVLEEVGHDPYRVGRYFVTEETK